MPLLDHCRANKSIHCSDVKDLGYGILHRIAEI